MRIFILAGFAALALAQRTPMKPEDVAAGRQLYRNSCAGCHGLTGEGGRGPNLMGGRAVSRSTDAALLQSLKFGLAGTDMPPTKLPDQKLWQILAFVRGLSAPAYEIPVEGDEKAGAAVYFGKGGCTRCHAIAGRGGVSGPDLTSIGHQRPLNLLREAVLDQQRRAVAQHRDRIGEEGLRDEAPERGERPRAEEQHEERDAEADARAGRHGLQGLHARPSAGPRAHVVPGLT
jgi:mono/diheme cytochrome c family protein